MRYLSTRDASKAVSAAQAIVSGLSPEGGLFVPESFPPIGLEEIRRLSTLSYQARAERILSAYLSDFTAKELHDCAAAAYAPARFGGSPAPLKAVGDLHVLELWHGPTHAFKDMALQMLPHLMVRSMEKTGLSRRVFILVATSGDTGKAALEGFCNVEGTQVGVFFPKDGVSPSQRLQMLTQEGRNMHVCAVEGNFDDAQTGVKRLFADADLAAEMEAKGYALSSANSINFGRLVPQIVYYFSAYADLLAEGRVRAGEPVNFCVPTGNFGNILAGYYAKRMGLPVGRLICASNRNNILFDFIQGGLYDTDRPFHKTSSPSMDILVSSNLERLLFELCGRKDQTVRQWMTALKSEGAYRVDEATLAALQADFSAGWADEAKAAAAIGACFAEHGYTLDPHTAVAYAVAKAYRASTGDDTPLVVVSTASPYKFSRDVLAALRGPEAVDGLDEFACADALEAASGLPMPESLKCLREKPLLHRRECAPEGMRAVVEAWAG